MFLLRRNGESCAPSCVMLLYALEHNDGELLHAVCAVAVEYRRAVAATKLLKNILYGMCWTIWIRMIGISINGDCSSNKEVVSHKRSPEATVAAFVNRKPHKAK